jgi:hypothetical protein
LTKEQRELQAYEEHLKSVELTFLKVVDSRAEQARLPSFVDYFHPYDRLQDFWERYWEESGAKDLYQDDEGMTIGVMARAYRAYASLLRESHLFYLLRSRYKYVVRGAEMDKEWGYDALVLANQKPYFVKAYYASGRGLYYATKKLNRHAKECPGQSVNLPLYKDKATVLGEVFVYNSVLIQPLVDAIGW